MKFGVLLAGLRATSNHTIVIPIPDSEFLNSQWDSSYLILVLTQKKFTVYLTLIRGRIHGFMLPYYLCMTDFVQAFRSEGGFASVL